MPDTDEQVKPDGTTAEAGEERPSREGRYRFTLAHEGGHWRLHRPLVQANRRQESLFGQTCQPVRCVVMLLLQLLDLLGQ